MTSSSDNLIKQIAIVGAGGQMGTYLVKELLKNSQFELTALTRKESPNPVPSGVKVAHIDYDNHESIVKALKGIQLLIITMAVQAAPGQEEKLVDAAADAGIEWIVPNNWGYDVTPETAGDYLIGQQYLDRNKYIHGKGIKTISFPCGYWYEYSLSGGTNMFGIDIPARKAVFYNDGNTRLSTSTWERTAESVAKVLSFPIESKDGESGGGGGLTISKWQNGCIHAPSYTLSQREMLDQVHKVLGTTDADWQIEQVDPRKATEEGLAKLKTGDRTGFAKALYSMTFYSKAPGDYTKSRTIDTETLGLTEEDLQACTRRAVEMAEKDYIGQRFTKMAKESQDGVQ